MDQEFVTKLILGGKYYTIDDLRHNKKIGIMLSREEFEEFLAIKDTLVSKQDALTVALPLKSFNSKYIFYVNGFYLCSLCHDYLRILLDDYDMNSNLLFMRHAETMAISRFYSEIEGTLNIENVPTTRQRIAEIHKQNDPKDENDIIVRNMIQAVRFIKDEKPAFNKENLRKLYSILSQGCLPEDKRLQDGAYYRQDRVYVGDYEGAPCEEIDACMDSLFYFANDPESIKEFDILFPYICHYYILYIHPYFDYNGRTARMVSFWLSFIHGIVAAPIFMSEAINETKGGYYRALSNTRNTNNDLTYFLGYILETSIEYCFVYKNLEEIKKKLAETGDTLTGAEQEYVKKILVHSPENYFNYKMFLEYIHSKMSKQGALKVLNGLAAYGILEKSKNKKGDTIYRLTPGLIVYQFNK